MPLTLDDLLAAAQNSQRRNPLVKIISDTVEEEIPFDGQLLTTETSDETDPNAITHSSGRIAAVYILNGSSIRYVYTNTDRTEFTNVSIHSSATITGVSLAEIGDGNIGVTWLETSGGSYLLKSKIISVEGDTISAAQTIATWSTSSTSRSPFVVALR